MRARWRYLSKPLKRGETSPIPFEQIIEVSKASCLAMDSVETGVYYKL